MKNFFDDYPEFITNFDNIIDLNHINLNLENLSSNLRLKRLNLRYQAFFKHREIWENASVLDLAGCDGRWSFAALKLGAKHATVVEVRKSVVEKGINTFKKLNVPIESYEFINADMINWRPIKEYDVVLCAGCLSHIYDQPTVFSIIRECNPKYLIVDTAINLYQGNVVIANKNINREGNSHLNFTSFVENDGLDIVRTWTSLPSRDFVFDLIQTYDFEVMEEFNWHKFIDQEQTVSVEDYFTKQRITLICKRRDGWRWDRKSLIK